MVILIKKKSFSSSGVEIPSCEEWEQVSSYRNFFFAPKELGNPTIFGCTGIHDISDSTLRSDDYGKTWVTTSAPGGSYFYLGSNAWIVLRKLGISCSSDDGVNWTSVLSLPTGSYNYVSYYIPPPPVRLGGGDLIGVFSKYNSGTSDPRPDIFRSVNNGVSWASITYPALPTQVIPYSLTVLDDGDTLFLGTSGRTGISGDGGVTWTTTTNDTFPSPFNPTDHFFLGLEDGVVLALDYMGNVARSVDSGNNWACVSTVHNSWFNCSKRRIISPAPGVLFTNGDTSVYRSDDYGETWSTVLSGLNDIRGGICFMADKTGKGVLLVGCYDGIWRTAA